MRSGRNFILVILDFPLVQWYNIICKTRLGDFFYEL